MISPQLTSTYLLLLNTFVHLTKRWNVARINRSRHVGAFWPAHHQPHRRQSRSSSFFTLRDNFALRAKKGTYVDLGSIDSNSVAISANEDYAGNINDIQTTEDALAEWRSKHWIVLIDDEPSIRLAIGDYLHSCGYKTVTACDGPMSFLETLLWSCGWSFSDKNANDLIVQNKQCPPWLEEGCLDKHPWRLPSIIISDIRMPGGIDGVQLLELLRRPPADAPKPEKIEGKMKGKRRRNKKGQIYDEEEYMNNMTTPDPNNILAGWVEVPTPIATPIDHATNLLDSIQNTLEYCKRISSKPAQNFPDVIQDIPVILLTAKAMVSDRIKGYKAGADGYLPKPFRPEELLRMVDNLMKRQDRERRARLTGKLYNSEEHGDHALSETEIAETTRELREIRQLLQKAITQKTRGLI